jgi:CBS domain-containing protein
MAIDLSSYRSIQTNLFVKIVIPGYETLTFSDYHKDYVIGTVTYQGLGQLLAVGNTDDNLRAAPAEITVTISGIPVENVTDVLNNKIKGSSCEIFRGFFNANTGELLPVAGNPAGKFRGVVSNYDITDDLEQGASTGSVSLILTVTSVVELLENKTTGRRTNAADFPNGDMDRVLVLQKSNFNFGAPQ